MIIKEVNICKGEYSLSFILKESINQTVYAGDGDNR